MIGEETQAEGTGKKNWPAEPGRFVLYSKENMMGWMTAAPYGEHVRVFAYCPRRDLTTVMDFEDPARARAQFEDAITKTAANGHSVVFNGRPLLDYPELLEK